MQRNEGAERRGWCRQDNLPYKSLLSGGGLNPFGAANQLGNGLIGDLFPPAKLLGLGVAGEQDGDGISFNDVTPQLAATWMSTSRGSFARTSFPFLVPWGPLALQRWHCSSYTNTDTSM